MSWSDLVGVNLMFHDMIGLLDEIECVLLCGGLHHPWMYDQQLCVINMDPKSPLTIMLHVNFVINGRWHRSIVWNVMIWQMLVRIVHRNGDGVDVRCSSRKLWFGAMDLMQNNNDVASVLFYCNAITFLLTEGSREKWPKMVHIRKI